MVKEEGQRRARSPIEVTVPEMLRLAIPSMIFAGLTNGYRLVDQYWLQDVSTEAQAAIGSSVFVLILYYALFVLIASGASPIVARAVGAGDDGLLRRVLGAALGGAGAVTVVLSLAGGLGAGWIAQVLGLSGDTALACETYIQVLSWTVLPLVLTPFVDQSFIAMGDARMPMTLHAVSLLLNIVLTPLLIVEAGLGVAGAALASNGSRAVTTGIGLWILLRRARPGWSDLAAMDELRRIVRVGTPVAVGVAMYTLVYWAMLNISISPLGPQVNAALGIGFSVLEGGMAFPCFNGISMATASFVGRALGAGQPEDARRAVRLALPLSTGLGIFFSAVFLFAGGPLADIFTDDPVVLEGAVGYATVLAFSQLFVAWETLCDGALNGSGATRTSFWISAPLNTLRVPLSWAFAFPLGMGAIGVWWAINLTTYAKTGLKAWFVWRGDWTQTKV